MHIQNIALTWGFHSRRFFKLMIRCDEILLTEGSSGLYVQSLFRDLEFKTSLEKKYKQFATGREMLTYLGQFCRHSNSNAWIVGLGANTEILQFESIGIKYLSGLPQELKHTTTYSIGMTTHTKRSDPANQFMNHLRLSQNWTLFKKSGFKWFFSFEWNLIGNDKPMFIPMLSTCHRI